MSPGNISHLAQSDAIAFRAEFDGEPAVQLSIEASRHDGRALDQQLTEAVERDATSGFLQRRYFLSRLGETIQSSLKGGVRQIAALQPDKFAALEVELGPLAIDEFPALFVAAACAERPPTAPAGGTRIATVPILPTCF